MEKFKLIVRWWLGISFSLGGLFLLKYSVVGGILISMTGILLLPPLKQIFESKTNRKVKTWHLVLLYLAGSMIVGVSKIQQKEKEDVKREREFAQLPKADQDSILASKAFEDSIKAYEATIAQKQKGIEERNKNIDEQFSPYDGAHVNLEKLIKENMHNPDTYQHVKTTYSVYSDYLIVVTNYRGANSFGAIVLNSIKAKVDLNGNIMEVIDK